MENFINQLVATIKRGYTNFKNIKIFFEGYLFASLNHWKYFGYSAFIAYLKLIQFKLLSYFLMWSLTMFFIALFSYEVTDSLITCMYAMENYLHPEIPVEHLEPPAQNLEPPAKEFDPSEESEKAAMRKKLKLYETSTLSKTTVVVVLVVLFLI